MNTITRRTALAVPVTLPLLPVSAFATPADPTVAAFRAWRAAFIAYERSFDRPHVADDDPIMNAACKAEWAAKCRISKPSSPLDEPTRSGRSGASVSPARAGMVGRSPGTLVVMLTFSKWRVR